MGSRVAYLDWNATSPPHPRVIEAMKQAQWELWGNPSSVHQEGRKARDRIEEVRIQLAELIHVSPRDLVFTSGGTEANNLALAGAPAILTSRVEHPSVARAAEAAREAGTLVRWLDVPVSGQIDPAAVALHLAGMPEGTLVAVQAVNHETGVVQPLREIGELCRAKGARLHVDAVQAFGKLPSELWGEGDLVAISGHKIRGPKGIGVLAWRCGGPPRAMFHGGAQQRGVRPGTLDAVLVSGLGAALDRVAEGPARYQSLASLRDWLESELRDLCQPNVQGAARAPHVASLYVPGWPAAELVAALDLEGVSVSSGSACSAGTPEPSAVVAAMLGTTRAWGTIRVSLGETTTRAEVEFAAAALRRVHGRLRGDGSGDARGEGS